MIKDLPPIRGTLLLILRKAERWHMRSLLRKHRDIPLRKAVKLWSLSDLIYLGPSGPRGRRLPEWELYDRYCKSPTPLDSELLSQVDHASPAVSAYAFEILLARDSELIPKALDLLLPRRELVSGNIGSFVCYQELRDYARHRHENRTENPRPATA